MCPPATRSQQLAKHRRPATRGSHLSLRLVESNVFVHIRRQDVSSPIREFVETDIHRAVRRASRAIGGTRHEGVDDNISFAVRGGWMVMRHIHAHMQSIAARYTLPARGIFPLPISPSTAGRLFTLVAQFSKENLIGMTTDAKSL